MSRPSSPYDDRDDDTKDAFENPQVGDRFSEMYSFWVYVIAVEPDGRIAVMEGHPPCRLPHDGKVRYFASGDEFRAAYTYGSIEGYWVSLASRGEKVAGWFQGWPAVDGPADCPRCAARLASPA